MVQINFLISTVLLTLILFVWKINSDTKNVQECRPNIKHPKYGNSCRVGCENCSHFSPDPNCKTDTRAPTDEKFCMPVIKQFSPTNGEVNLCELPINGVLKDFVRGAKLKDICIDVFWSKNCEEPSSNITISYENCVIDLKLKNAKKDSKCVTVSVCRILPITELINSGTYEFDPLYDEYQYRDEL